MGPKVERQASGAVELSGLAPWVVAILRELVSSDEVQPGTPMASRLYPDPYDNEDDNEEWRRLVHPELFALYASSRAILARDLESLRIEDDEGELVARLHIPAEHVQAWLHALGAERLSLAEEHALSELDLDQEELEVTDERSAALARVHLMGWLQQLLVECEAEGLD